MMGGICVALTKENGETGVLPLNYSRLPTKREGYLLYVLFKTQATNLQ
jgi:hypothetical protein